jgi:WD40 repeat protein
VLLGNNRAPVVLDLQHDELIHLSSPGAYMFRETMSGDGRLHVAGFGDGRLLLWNVDGGTAPPRLLARRDGFISGLFFTPDDRTLVVSDETGSLARIDLATGAVAEIGRHPARIVQARLSPSGRRIATSDTTGEVRVWALGSGDLAVVRGQSQLSIDFADDDHLVATTQDGWMQLTTLGAGSLVPGTPAALGRWLDALTTARLDATGEPVSTITE